MDIIVTGSTGQIGSTFLTTALSSSSISKIHAPTRRPLSISDSSLNNPIHTDFKHYPSTLLAQFANVQTCIWTMGVLHGKVAQIAKERDCPELDVLREVDVEYSMAAAEAFLRDIQPTLGGKKFRFIFVSGAGAERDANQSFWFMEDVRTSKGEAERALLEFARQNSDRFEVIVVRPGGVVDRNTSMPNVLLKGIASLREDQLAAVLLHLATNGSERDTLYSGDVCRLGMALVP